MSVAKGSFPALCLLLSIPGFLPGAAPPAVSEKISPETQKALESSYWTGSQYATAALWAIVTPYDQRGIKNNLENARMEAVKLGVKLGDIPSFRTRSTLDPTPVEMMKTFRAGPFADAAVQIEKKCGKECRRIFEWAWVMSVASGAIVNDDQLATVFSQDAVRELVQQYTTGAGLPEELGTPLLLVTKSADGTVASSNKIRIAACRCEFRTLFYIQRVLPGHEDFSVLANPAFDTKREAAVLADVNKEKDARLAKELAEMKSTPHKLILLLIRLNGQDRVDPNDIIGQNLRGFGHEAIPAICFCLGGTRESRHVSVPAAQTALDMVVFKRKAAEVYDGVTAEMIKGWDGALAVDIAKCLRAKDTQVGAGVALRRLTLQSNGKLIPVLVAARVAATGEEAESLDNALGIVARAHVNRAFTRITEYLAANPSRDTVPDTVRSGDLEAVRQTGEPGRRALAQLGEQFTSSSAFVGDLAGEEMRAFVEDAGIIPASPPAIRAERKRAVVAWTAAAKSVNTQVFPFIGFRQSISRIDAHIAMLESLLEEPYTEQFRAPSALGFGYIVVEMQRNAAAAGRFALRKEVVADIEKDLEVRNTFVKMYRDTFEMIANRKLTPQDRALVVKYGLMSAANAKPLTNK